MKIEKTKPKKNISEVVSAPERWVFFRLVNSSHYLATMGNFVFSASSDQGDDIQVAELL